MDDNEKNVNEVHEITLQELREFIDKSGEDFLVEADLSGLYDEWQPDGNLSPEEQAESLRMHRKAVEDICASMDTAFDIIEKIRVRKNK